VIYTKKDHSPRNKYPSTALFYIVVVFIVIGAAQRGEVREEERGWG
jgi:hypothetical protein